MKTLKILGLGFALAIASSAAGAFQEQRTGGASVVAPAAQAPVDGKDLNLGTDSAVAAKPATGTEVRIPGLGKLGVLPKMDFGLELLYGAAEAAKSPEAQQGTAGDQDDLTIRGTLKHRW